MACRLIEGFDGDKPIFKREVPSHHLGEKQASRLIQLLAARHLDCEEIVGACLSRRAPMRRDLLVICRERNRHGLAYGDSPFYTVRFKRDYTLMATQKSVQTCSHSARQSR